MKARLIYHPKATETVNLIKDIGKAEFGIDFILLPNGIVKNGNNTFLFGEDNYVDLPDLRYGCDGMSELSKVDQIELLSDIVPNVLLSFDDFQDLNQNEPVILKNPTRLVCKKDVDWYDAGGEVYRFIKEKEEWRVNYSFGKVNSILNKNITNQPFGKANLTDWSVERDSGIRMVLIFLTKRIAERISSLYPDVTHFGIDFIRDKTDNKIYFLELNRAHALNEEGVRRLLKGYVEKAEDSLLGKLKKRYGW